MSKHDYMSTNNVHPSIGTPVGFLFIFLPCSCKFEQREMFLLGSGTGFPFMSVFDIRDMLRP